jgi:hypothetical protein
MGADISAEAAWRRSRIVVPVASPAAGADWRLTVPAGHVYRVASVAAQFVTSATVATRVPFLTFSDGNATFLQVPPFASQAASLTRQYAWFPESGGDTTAPGIATPMPLLALQAGWTIGVATTAIDTTDQWSAVYLLVLDTTVRAGDVDIDSLPDLIVELVGPNR